MKRKRSCCSTLVFSSCLHTPPADASSRSVQHIPLDPPPSTDHNALTRPSLELEKLLFDDAHDCAACSDESISGCSSHDKEGVGGCAQKEPTPAGGCCTWIPYLNARQILLREILQSLEDALAGPYVHLEEDTSSSCATGGATLMVFSGLPVRRADPQEHSASNYEEDSSISSAYLMKDGFKQQPG